MLNRYTAYNIILVWLFFIFYVLYIQAFPPINYSKDLKPTASATASIIKQKPNKPSSFCLEDMIFVHGKFCLLPEQKCLDWIDDPVKYPYARCRLFDKSICKSSRKNMSFCIDKLEASGKDNMPIADISWTAAKASCEKIGKRLCKEEEWLFACEGEESLPYPYGYERDSTICNFEIKDGLVNNKGDLADYRMPVTSNILCLSPFGVQNMVGNIDEWVVLDKPHFSAKNNNRKMMSGLKGGWWGVLRNRCRPTTVDHDEHFHQLQTGYRCCADVKGEYNE